MHRVLPDFRLSALRSRAPVLLRPGVRMIGLRLLRLRLRNGHGHRDDLDDGRRISFPSGASILLALLFFLVCAMVGASVLMAAASNAGKSRSSREEQQKYLTLSSAMQLVCDESSTA